MHVNFQEDLLHDLVRDKGGTDWLVAPWSSLFVFLKMGAMFPLFQLVGTSLDFHNFSDMMDSGEVTSLTSCLWTCGCISSFPWTCPPSSSSDGLRPDLLLASLHCALLAALRILNSTISWYCSQGWPQASHSPDTPYW